MAEQLRPTTEACLQELGQRLNSKKVIAPKRDAEVLNHVLGNLSFSCGQLDGGTERMSVVQEA